MGWIVSIARALVSLVVARAMLEICHSYGFYPERLLASLTMGALGNNLAFWIVLSFVSLILWLIFEFSVRKWMPHKLSAITGSPPEKQVLSEDWPAHSQPVPNVECSFDMNDPGCVRPNTNIFLSGPDGQARTLATWFRIKVETIHRAEFCTGRLLSVKRAGSELLAGERPMLAFAPREDADSRQKLIHPGVPEYLDFLWANQTEGAQIPTIGIVSQAVRWDRLFEMPGDYIISVGITHSSPTMARIDLQFRWTLDPITSSISIVQ